MVLEINSTYYYSITFNMKNKAINKAIQDSLTPDIVIKDLMEGNKRFLSKTTLSVDHSALIEQTSKGQFPKAIILACVDSRVPVETIFDQAIGDVFVARVAGNFENTDILGSLEFACKVSGSKVVLILGHEGCGAVKAACDGVELGHITDLLNNIKPAVEASKETTNDIDTSSKNKNFVDKTIVNNVNLTISRIRQKSSILKQMEASGDIKIIGGVYKISSGKVELL